MQVPCTFDCHIQVSSGGYDLVMSRELGAIMGDVISQRLTTGEQVIWSGKPAGGLFFRAQDIFVVPFTLIWLIFAVGMSAGAASFLGASVFSLLFVGFFLGIGLFMLIGRFLLDMWLRRRTHYALTDRRILILRTGPFPRATSIGLNAIPEAQLRLLSGGRGTIRFGQPPSGAGNTGSMVPALDATPEFLDIHDASKVYDLVQETAGRIGRPDQAATR